jgi:hypothetical protein
VHILYKCVPDKMRPLVYLGKLSLYLNDFEPSKDGLHLVLQGLDFAKLLSNFSAIPLKACQRKVFKLTAIKFGQKLGKRQTDTKNETELTTGS